MKVFSRRSRQFVSFVSMVMLVVLAGMFFFHEPTLAQVDVGLQVGEETGLSGTDPRVIIARVIQVALGFLGVVTIGLLVYAGFLWMTAAGSPERVDRAKTILRNGVIGLAIILSAFGIVTFVLQALGQVSNTPNFNQGVNFPGFFGGGGGFANGVIESHYPDRGQTDVARNTNIMVTFFQPILEETVVNRNGTPEDSSDDTLNTQNIRILRAIDDSAEGPFVAARASMSEDGRSIIIDPIDFLGTPDENIRYKVILGEGISTSSGRPAFGNFGAYEWEFEVGTFIDLDPPIVESVFPITDTTQPRNVVIQINFNEAMNPLTVTGDVAKGFENISARLGSGERIDGTFVISNQYRTVEFITTDLCGTNSCGEDVFCLPGNQDISVLAIAAAVSIQPPQAAFPFNGVTDAAGNSLDGNVDGGAEGTPIDDYQFSFQTTDQIDLTAPQITNVTPAPFATLVDRDAPVSATFSKPLLFKSINRESVQLEGADYRIISSTKNGESTIRLDHSAFTEDATFTPAITSGVRDLYQNCYNPCIGP